MSYDRSDLHFKKGYVYQLDRRFYCKTNIQPDTRLCTEYICLDTNGDLYIERGYAWDGASGPTINTPSTMAASLVHDALYQLISLELLGFEWREDCDKELQRIMIEDGAYKFRADYFFLGVEVFGGKYARKVKNTTVLCPGLGRRLTPNHAR